MAKYALRFDNPEVPGPYILNNLGWGTGEFALDDSCVFDGIDGIQKALQKRAPRRGAGPMKGVEIVEVEEVPGETRHEVVELSGVVDLTDLKFAVYYPHRDGFLNRGMFGGLGRVGKLNGEGEWDALVFDTMGDMIDTLHEARSAWGGGYGLVPARIVGIRETTTPSTYRIVE